MAKNYPNVYMDGYWWYCFFPESISQHLLERIQILLAGKYIFYSVHDGLTGILEITLDQWKSIKHVYKRLRTQ
ncbi:MAG: hypothetical protein QXV75_07505, partial [Candidatus Bathyarchaeia archaeon]